VRCRDAWRCAGTSRDGFGIRQTSPPRYALVGAPRAPREVTRSARSERLNMASNSELDNADYESILRSTNERDIQEWRNYLDLNVQLAVELGRTRLTAREVLALEENSLIKLPRSTGEGADVLAGGLRIARGEIIMIEDRTGVRINEIIAKVD